MKESNVTNSRKLTTGSNSFKLFAHTAKLDISRHKVKENTKIARDEYTIYYEYTHFKTTGLCYAQKLFKSKGGQKIKNNHLC